MNLVFSSDNNYAQHLGVTLCSLFENNKGENLNIYVIDGGIDQENKIKLAQLENSYAFKIEYVKPNKELFKDVYLSGHISEATYYRLSIGELLPPSIDKILYLDCDIIITGKIRELWNSEQNSNIISAVTEAGMADPRSLGIARNKDYFNAGILLIDLRKWREQNIGKKCFDFIRDNPDKIVLWDQDTLNGVFCGQWQKLDNRFNLMTQTKEKVDNPIIIHFNSWIKPWHYLCNHPQKSLYTLYLRMTPWKNYKPRLPTIKELLRYYYNTLISQNIRINIRKYVFVPLGFRKGAQTR